MKQLLAFVAVKTFVQPAGAQNYLALELTLSELKIDYMCNFVQKQLSCRQELAQILILIE